MTALQSLDHTSKLYEGELLTKLSALFKMKNQNWIEIDFNNWQNNEAYEKTFNDLKFAILNRNMISFSYFSSNQEKNMSNGKTCSLII